MNDMTVFDNAQLPAAFQTDAKALANELSEGVLAGFPILSFRGKVWRMKKGEDEIKLEDPTTGDPVPSIPVVLIAANNKLSKIYYPGTYEEGSNEKPTCFSVGGVLPDSSVDSPIHTECATCPMNVWGSKISPNGKKIKACSDTRRLAVSFVDGPDGLREKGAAAMVFLLRVPGASLQNLKIYGEKTLGERGWPFYAVTTRVGFDADSSYPQLTFRPTAPVDAGLATAILELRESEMVKTITTAGAEMATTPTPSTAPTGVATVTPIAPPEPEVVTTEPTEPPPVEEPSQTSQAAATQAAAPSPEPEEGSDDALKDLLGGLDDTTTG